MHQGQRYIRSALGYSLVELLVILVIVAILIAVAVPSFSSSTVRHQLDNSIGEFASSNRLARSESITRGKTVVICKSDDATATAPSCGDDSVNWEDGWLVFVNTDRDNPPVIDAGEEVIRAGKSLEVVYTLRPSSNLEDAIIYNSMGEIEQPGTMVLCKSGNLEQARVLILQTIGRTTVAELNSRGVPIDEDGNAFDRCDPN